MTVCPQCGYERKNSDDKFISAEECPKCGIFYKKWEPSSISNNTEAILTSNEASNINKEKKKIRYKSIISTAIIFIVLAIFAKFTFFSRIESTLPVTPPRGIESNSYLIRASGIEETITAAGQIFTPPHQTPVLFKLGFMFTQYSFTKQVPDFKLQVRLSEWAGDHPGQTALWVSEPRAIPSTTDDFQADWADFNVPYLPLDPKKQYVAWVTLSSLENPPDASVGIPGMGPIYSTLPSDSEREQGSGRSPYPQGIRVLYKQENLDGDVSQMTNSAWEVHDIGHNLHFRMSFENNRIVVCGITLFINSNNKHDNKDSENYDSQSRMSEIILQKTKNAIIKRGEKERQKQEVIKQQQGGREIQHQEEIERRQVEMEQRQEEMERQQVEREQQQEQQQEERKRQFIEREIQQYEREKQQEEMKQKQEEMMRQQQGNILNREPRRVQRIPRRR